MKILKIIGYTLLVLLVVAGVVHLYASRQVKQRLQKEYSVQLEKLELPPADSALLAEGKHLIDIKGCADCHGDRLEGKTFNDDLLVGQMAGPNLTKGKGGLPSDYSTEDWVRALKHGLNRENKPLLIMPSEETSHMSAEDMQALISYINSLAPIDNDVPENKLGLMMTTLVCFDQVPVIAAEKIDHQKSLVRTVDRSLPLDYGKYLAVMCSGCHRENMKGGEPLAPGFPPVPDLTSTGAAGKWTQEQFNATLRTGKRPNGTELDPSMPWQMTKHYSDQELTALYTYFKSL